MIATELQILKTDIIIRPSAVDTFINCSYKWAKTFLEGKNTIPNSRAVIGTGIHGGAEVMWNDAIDTGIKDLNSSKAIDASVEKFREELEKGIQYDTGEDQNTCEAEIIKGTKTFMTDIAEWADIPVAVEKRLSVEVSDHPIVSGVSGTVDYLTFNTIADLKTSKRKPNTSNYKTQQSIYHYLAESNNLKINHTLIQGVVLKKEPEGHVLTIDTDVDQAKYIMNSMLDTLEFAAKGTVPLEVLFRGNPKYYLCSSKYCSEYATCPFVQGEIKTASKEVKKAIEL